MSQVPVSMKLTVTPKGNLPLRSGVVQVIQSNQSASQSLLTQTSPVYKNYSPARSLVSATTGFPINTNTAVQYVRKPLEMTVLNPASAYVAASPGQTFSHFGGPLMTLNPNVMQSMSGSGNMGTNSLSQLGAPGGGLSSLANSRKPCNCTKSHCLKLYCECFAQGQLCQNCNCNNCMNNLAYEEERGRAIKMTLERNPTAFHPKIGRGEGERKHTKGCNCKRSGCLKNYCECYEAKISCSDLCRCQGCRNTEDSVERRSLMRLAAMGSLRSRQPASLKKHLIKPHAETLPHVFFTWEVIEALTTCLLTQAEEGERRDLPIASQERIVLEEFGRILENIIDSASKAQVRPSAGSITAQDSDGEAAILHGAYGSRNSGVGAATAAAAAADVLLRNDDDDDEDQIMRQIGVDDDDDDPRDIDDDLFDDELGEVPHHHHTSRHTRHSAGRRRAHMADFLDEAVLSDEELVTSSSRHQNASVMSQKYRSRQRAPDIGSYHSTSRHSRRSLVGRDHEKYDPDSVV